MGNVKQTQSACYPNFATAKFSRVNGKVQSYRRLDARMQTDIATLDIGAGCMRTNGDNKGVYSGVPSGPKGPGFPAVAGYQ